MESLRQRDATTSFDDTNPGFNYVGDWQEITGSTRQWDGGIQSTQQTGAKMSFNFFGTFIYKHFFGICISLAN